jgi:hypothetical protein
VPWKAEDWSPWLAAQRAGSNPQQQIVHALREILRKIPSSNRRTIIDLSRGAGVASAFLDRNELPEFDILRRELTDIKQVAGGADLIILVDAELDLASASGRTALERIYSSLKDGGLLVAAFPAVIANGTQIELRLGETDHAQPSFALHEVDLQYRLFRTGFQGIRIRRFKADDEQRESLLCMAIRRANN